MRKTIFAAVLAGGAAIFAATSFVPAPAQAAVGVTFDFGNIAFAYTDGYYDHYHRWHHWRRGEWNRYRHHHNGRYYNWRHDDHRHHHHDYRRHDRDYHRDRHH